MIQSGEILNPAVHFNPGKCCQIYIREADGAVNLCGIYECGQLDPISQTVWFMLEAHALAMADVKD